MNSTNTGSTSDQDVVSTTNHDSAGDAVSSDGAQHIRQEIPFLVTHWLANYGKNIINDGEEIQDPERIAISKIQRATSEIASAFATLGAYGKTLRVSKMYYCVFIRFFFILVSHLDFSSSH